MSELEEDIKHCEEVLADWHGCDECKADHERLLSYMKELLEYRKAKGSIMTDNTDIEFSSHVRATSNLRGNHDRRRN